MCNLGDMCTQISEKPCVPIVTAFHCGMKSKRTTGHGCCVPEFSVHEEEEEEEEEEEDELSTAQLDSVLFRF